MRKFFVILLSYLMCQPVMAVGIDIAVLSPMVMEANAFAKKMSDVKITSIDNRHYYIGNAHGKRIVHVVTGMGEVNAAITTLNVIKHFHPKLILVEGTAGAVSPKLAVGSVVVGKEVYPLERDKMHFSDKKEVNPPDLYDMPEFFKPTASLLAQIEKFPAPSYSVELGKIATSNNLPSLPSDIATLHKDHADVVEMEGSAVMQVCWLYKTNCLIIRSNSNLAVTKENAPVFTQTGLDLSTYNAADFADRLIKYIHL